MTNNYYSNRDSAGSRRSIYMDFCRTRAHSKSRTAPSFSVRFVSVHWLATGWIVVVQFLHEQNCPLILKFRAPLEPNQPVMRYSVWSVNLICHSYSIPKLSLFHFLHDCMHRLGCNTFTSIFTAFIDVKYLHLQDFVTVPYSEHDKSNPHPCILFL